MTATSELQLVITAKDEATKVLNGLQRSTSAVGSTLKTAAKASAVAFTAAAASVTAFGVASMKAYSKYQTLQTQLETVLKNTKNATKEDVKVLLDQAAAMERVGVVSDDVTMSFQARLAQYDYSIDTIKKLTPAILDMLVAEKGANATAEDGIFYAEGFGKAMQGQFEILRKRGFVISEATERIMKYGTEEQRAAEVFKLLGKTYEGVNAAMRDTPVGAMAALGMAWDNVKKSVGEALSTALQPTFKAISDWVASEQFTATLEGIKIMIQEWIEALGGPEGIKNKLLALVKYITEEFIPMVASLIENVASITKFLWEHRDAVMAGVIVWAALKTGLLITGIISAVTTFIGGLTFSVAALNVALSASVVGLTAVALVMTTKAIVAYKELTKAQKEVLASVDANNAALDTFQTKVGSLSTAKANEQLQNSINKARELNKEAEKLGKLGFFGSVWSGVKGLFGKEFGGAVSAGNPYIVGERRPEVFVPSQSGNIRQMGQVGEKNITINFNNASVRNESDLDAIVNAVKRTLSREQELARIGAY